MAAAHPAIKRGCERRGAEGIQPSHKHAFALHGFG